MLVVKLKNAVVKWTLPDALAQSVTCLATEASLTVDPEFDPVPVPYFRGD